MASTLIGSFAGSVFSEEMVIKIDAVSRATSACAVRCYAKTEDKTMVRRLLLAIKAAADHMKTCASLRYIAKELVLRLCRWPARPICRAGWVAMTNWCVPCPTRRH
jgi:hypothetical protein